MSSRRYYARKLFELSGLIPVGAFLLEHLYSNFQAVGPGGRERFDKVVVDLQTNPLILFLEIVAIALPLLYHAGYGLYVAQQARPNAGEYGYLRNWTYVFQRITGVVLFLYIGYHVWNTRFYPLLHPADPTLQHLGDAAMVSSSYMHRYLGEAHGGVPVFWIYVVGVSCAAYHFANGVWNAGVHWGLFMSTTAQRLAGWACVALGAGLAFLGIESLLAFTRMGA